MTAARRAPDHGATPRPRPGRTPAHRVRTAPAHRAPSPCALPDAATVGRRVATLGLSAALVGALGLYPVEPLPSTGAAPSLVPAALAVAAPAVRLGARGPAVVALQRELGVTADGVFGPRTRAAVRTFQASRRLSVDGVVGPRTWRALGAAAAARAAAAKAAAAKAAATRVPAAGATPTTVLREGAEGPAVVALQRVLGLRADGGFGPVTRSAVARFQAQRRLVPDGVVGPRTAAALALARGDRVVQEAARHVGTPYEWAGSGPDTFDCSGLTRYVYARLGVDLPHNSAAQYAALPHVPASAVRRGDLVFTRTRGTITHVGIYDRDGYWYVAPRAGTTVQRQKVYTTDVLVARPA